MKRRQSTKTFEQANALHASLKLGEDWKFEPHESPDFVVTAADCRFGLEVTQCQIGKRGRKGSEMRKAESARQAWLDDVRADYEGKNGASLNLKYQGGTTQEARDALIETLFANDFNGPVQSIPIQRSGVGARVTAFETPNAYWAMPEDRAGEVSRDNSYLRRVIDEKAEKLPLYRVACADVRLLVVADHIYNSGKLQLGNDFSPDLKGFNTVYFFAYPRTVVSFHAPENK